MNLLIFRLSENQIIVDIQRSRHNRGVVRGRQTFRRDRQTFRRGHMEGWSRQDAVVCSDKHQPTEASMTQCSSRSSQIQTVTKASAVNLLAPHSSKCSVNTSCSDPNMAILNVVESVSCDNKLPGERNRKHDQLVKPGRRVDLSTQLPCQPELTGQYDDDLMYSSRELVRWDPCMSPIQGSDSFRIPFIESITMQSSFDESLQDMSLPCQPNCTMVTEEQKIVTSYSSQSVRIDRLLVNSVSIDSVMAEQSWLPRQPNCTLATIATDTESDRSEAEDWEGSRLGKLDWEQGMASADGRRSSSLQCSTPEPTRSRFNFTVSQTFMIYYKLWLVLSSILHHVTNVIQCVMRYQHDVISIMGFMYKLFLFITLYTISHMASFLQQCN